MKKLAKFQYVLLLMPSLLLSFCVILVPAFQTVVTSFTEWNGMSNVKTFVGLQNYIELFNNEIFRMAVVNNIKWMIIYLIVPVAISMMAAYLLYTRRTGAKTAFQTVYLLPYIIAPIANSIIWLNMIYSPVSGIIGFLNSTFGWELHSPLTNVDTAIFGVAAVDIWRYWGFLTVVFLASLRQIPEEQIEAAEVEGANFWQIFKSVCFPNILPTFRLMLIMIVIQSFTVFDYVYLLTRGGPANSTEMLGTVAYSYAFTRFRYGMASATSLIMSLLGLIASIFYVRFNRKEEMQ